MRLRNTIAIGQFIFRKSLSATWGREARRANPVLHRVYRSGPISRGLQNEKQLPYVVLTPSALTELRLDFTSSFGEK